MKSKILNVRISDKTYSSLASFATLSDRSMSQICRYAISALDSDAPIEIIEGIGDSDNTTVSFRITENDITFINKLAMKNAVSVSDVVRAAISIWLSNNKAKTPIAQTTSNSPEVPNA